MATDVIQFIKEPSPSQIPPGMPLPPLFSYALNEDYQSTCRPYATWIPRLFFVAFMAAHRRIHK